MDATLAQLINDLIAANQEIARLRAELEEAKKPKPEPEVKQEIAGLRAELEEAKKFKPEPEVKPDGV